MRVAGKAKPRKREGLAEAWDCTDRIFQSVPDTAWYDRPVPVRHRLLFYLGHVEAFDWNLMAPIGFTLPSFHQEFNRLFAFGIDPQADQLPNDKPSDWPSVDEVRQYVIQIRKTLEGVSNEISSLLLDVAIEHRLMHAETFTSLLHNLDQPLPLGARSLLSAKVSSPAPVPVMIDIPAGTATLGRRRRSIGSEDGIGSDGFGWDNEFHEHLVVVPSFAISKYKVTNAQYLTFVEAGAAPPFFWRRRHNRWFWRTLWGEIPLPLDWPVYVTHQEAAAYASWAGKFLPTEAQFHRAAYGTAMGEERRYPWGAAPPEAQRGNFNFQRWDPISVTASPLGESAWGVAQLVGNGWEWTATVFGPFPGFQPFPFYPGYSAPFFDGDHFVLKGGSSHTAARLLRRSFRNWFRPGHPYVYAGFRCVDN
ncbi:MAG: hypothetical protein K0S58_2968 [Nitrospira sp.]|jgi:formylglycine-generating enzyme required for sulfatase activity|nr:hypothetical protein [Nitrospira sp.]